MQITLARPPQQEAHQTARLNIDTKDSTSSIRICFTDQRLTAHGGMIVWSHFLHQKRFRRQLREALPRAPTGPNAYAPTDVALGYACQKSRTRAYALHDGGNFFVFFHSPKLLRFESS